MQIAGPRFGSQGVLETRRGAADQGPVGAWIRNRNPMLAAGDNHALHVEQTADWQVYPSATL